MVILSMTATFGCLENATLTLQEGLNLLELPNESGKSTWCAFLRAMLYGLEARKGGEFSERNRHTPWSGSPMAGTMDLLWQGKAITLRRFPKGSDPFGGFQAVYTGTEAPVPGLTAANAGEVLLGLTKEVFQRTCFIPQGAVGVDASGDLERRIAALAAFGEEDVSYSDAEGRLRDWRNARQSNRATGSLPKLRARLEEVQSQRRRLLDARSRGTQAQARLEELKAEKALLEDDLARHAAQAQARQTAQAQARCDAAGRRLALAQDALAAAQAEESAAQTALPPPPGPPWAWAIPLWAGLLLAVGLILLFFLLKSRFLAALAVCLAGAGLLAAVCLKKKHTAAQTAFDAANALWTSTQAALAAAQAEHIAAQAAWETISAQDLPPRQTASAPPPQATLAEDQARLAQVQTALTLCADQLSRSKGEEEALGGLGPLEEQAAALAEQLAQEEEELAALNLALEALAAANAQLQARFSPALNAKAGELLAQLTAGRYSALTFTRSFEALAQTPGGGRDTRLLSRGAADQTYLALRLAVCLLALPQDDPAPLVLDDALVSFDDARLALALDLLGRLAQDRQVLLFTCQGRERAALGLPPCNFHREPL